MKTKVLVGIPSCNEADSIGNVVKKVDTGLVKLFKPAECVIVNIDSGSNDDTQSVFLTTKTQCRKHQINIGKKNRGKGKNIFALLQYCQSVGAKFVATMDADLLTIESEWIYNLLYPIITRQCEYVCPLYSRNRFEGSTTNHLAVPILYASFDVIIRQPIGGEFAMSENVVQYLLKQDIPTDAFKYGIDMFMTYHAIGGGFKVGERFLGKKFHKPSFPKIMPMFAQIAQTAFECTHIYSGSSQMVNYVNLEPSSRCGIDDKSLFPHKNKIKKLLDDASLIFQQHNESYQYILGDFFPVVNKRINEEAPYFTMEEWVETLFLFASKFLRDNNKDILNEKLGWLLAQIFIWRAATFWLQAEKLTADEVDSLILTQAENIKKRFKE